MELSRGIWLNPSILPQTVHLSLSIYARMSRNPSLTPDQIERMGVDKVYSYQKARSDFNFSPISFEDGIEKLIKELETYN